MSRSKTLKRDRTIVCIIISMENAVRHYLFLNKAIYDRQKNLVELLLNKGAKINQKTGIFELSPLHVAAIANNREICEILIDRSADVNAKDKHNCRPLHWAAKAGYIDIVEILLDRGAEVNITNDRGWTPLIRAFQKSGGNRTITILLDYGANVNFRDSSGTSPLHIAVAQNNKNIVELLLDRGATEGLL